MKKIALSAVLCLFLQAVPVKAIPINEHFAGYSVIAIIGSTLGSFSFIDAAPEVVAKGEFEQLNSIPENVTLLTQTAGGSLNTLDILK